MGDFEEMKQNSEEEMERFGPLRVLLVEADDSTRNVIASLLRKCSYQVTTASDGLRAWETLKGGPQNVDLILTEVELPSISGYGLLTLKMENDIGKNIPVIMMSPKDSVSTVLKCMLRGAADFLIKPVRKNELRNLWQHVWRRQTQIVGNDPQNPTAPKNFDITPEKHAGSSNPRDYLSSSARNKENISGSSDLQGQPQMRIESMCRLSNTRRHQESNQKSSSPKTDDKANMTNSFLMVASCHEVGTSAVTEPHMRHVCTISKAKYVEVEPENHTENGYIYEENCEVSESPTEATDLIGKFDTSPENFRHFSANDITESPFTKLELSLRRSNSSCLEDGMSEDIVTFNHSKASAFSRYDNSKLRQTSPRFSGNLAIKHEGENAYHGRLDAELPGSQGNTNSFCQQEHSELELPDICLGFTSLPRVKLASTVMDSSHLYSLEYYPESDLSSDWSLKSQHEQSSKPTNSSIHSTSEVHDTPNKDCAADFNEEDEKLEAAVRYHSSNGVRHKLSLKRCRSISDASEVNNTAASEDISKATLSESVNDNNVLAYDGSRETSSHHNSQREAALNKFRLKRKDRCYEKKVRYQSRKKLAEQRPRVKGQFIRQGAI